MTDIAVVYTLEAPGGTIVFNDAELGSFDDMYFITDIRGLGGPPLRTPQSNNPQAHGGRAHKFWKGPRHIVIEGEYLIQSTRVMNDIQELRNGMVDDLEVVLESLLQTTGTLTFTPAGLTERTYEVTYEQPVEDTGVEQHVFVFGLFAGEPDWGGSS